jgi:hypothetical protein
MSENNESTTQNAADIAFQLRAIGQQLELLSRTYKDLKDEVNSFFFGKLTYVLKEEDTNIIRGIPQIYNDNRNIKQQMATG